MRNTPGELWWSYMSGPRDFAMKAADALISDLFPLLCLPPDLPFRHDMRRAIRSCLVAWLGSEDWEVETIDAEDELPRDAELAGFLLERLGGPELAALYREGSGLSVQDYLVEMRALRRRIVWVKGVPAEQMCRWIEFLRGFREQGLEKALFRLACRGGPPAPSLGPGVRLVSFDSPIQRHDLYYFSYKLVSERLRLSPEWMDYMAAAAARLCEYDAEVSEGLLAREDWDRTEPFDMLLALSREPRFGLRGRGAGSSHVLALVRAGERRELEGRLWKAQLETLFPRLELFRQQLVEELRDELLKALGPPWPPLAPYNEVIESPDELELGSVRYLMDYKSGSDRRLYVNDARLREDIRRMTVCRNKMAHRKCCEPQEVRAILELRLARA